MIKDKKHELFDTTALQEKDVRNWINNGANKDLLEQVKQFGKYIASDLKKARHPKKPHKTINESVSTSQIRQIFSKLKTIEAKGGLISTNLRTTFMMLKPFLAYAAGRHDTSGLTRLKDRLSWAIDEVISGDTATEQQRFYNFCRLFEAILAYHRANGGK